LATYTHNGKRANYVYRRTFTGNSGDHMHSVLRRTETTGLNTQFDNRPPYYTVVYIVHEGTDDSPLF